MADASFEIYKDIAGKFRFRLKAPNNKIVAVGEGCETKAGCMNSVKAVKKYYGAKIKDLTFGETTLILNKPPNDVKEGSTVTFSGKLVRDDTEEGVGGAKVDIYESDRSFRKDNYMASGKTRSDGSFNIEWKAKEMDWWDNTVEVFSKFEGSGSLKPSTSKQYVITVYNHLYIF